MAVQDNPSHPSFPDYPQMVMGAIEALNDKEGSSKESITRYIESNYVDLPPTLATQVSHTLDKLKQTGQLLMLKENSYVIKEVEEEEESEEEEEEEDDVVPTNGVPIKRGRGRPPKPKTGLPTVAAAHFPPRPRGRPPKPRDPLAPVTRPVKAPSSGRPRGRPKKNPSEDGGSGPTAASGFVVGAGGVKRGRGRPRKN